MKDKDEINSKVHDLILYANLGSLLNSFVALGSVESYFYDANLDVSYTRILHIFTKLLEESKSISSYGKMNFPEDISELDVLEVVYRKYHHKNSTILASVAKEINHLCYTGKCDESFAKDTQVVQEHLYKLDEVNEKLEVHKERVKREWRRLLSSRENADPETEVAIKNNKIQSKSEYIIPDDLAWKQLVISLLDSERCNVHIDDSIIGQYTYKELGFGKRKPSKEWKLLEVFSILQLNIKAKADVGTLLSAKGLGFKKRENVERSVSTLRKKLKLLFGQTKNPIKKHNEFGEYKLEFTLNPTPDLRQLAERYSKNEEYLDEVNYTDIET